MPTARPSGRPMPGMVPIMFSSPIGGVDGLLGLAGIAERAFDEEVHDRDGDVGQQQARDGLVDAAVVAEHADEADPDARRRARPRRSSPAW